ncbi:MAG: ribosome maturation factor RimM [Deltaproteobacteria bacterium]|nr:ribosome maturation factor RimM [Deltaproteobacteria bacterium]
MDLFAVGEIVKTRGLRGCLKVLSYVETKNNFSKLEFVYIENSFGQKNRFGLRKFDASGKSFFIELESIADAESAKALVGCKVFLPKNMLEQLSDGEYYWQDIIGLDVYNEEGNYLGKIESIFPTGSNDVYVCRGEKKEILLPAIADVIRRIDINNRVMTVRLLEGL